MNRFVSATLRSLLVVGLLVNAILRLEEFPEILQGQLHGERIFTPELPVEFTAQCIMSVIMVILSSPFSFIILRKA